MILFSKPINLIMALLFWGSAFSQLPDTVVVYEYIYVTDTVWIEAEMSKLKQIDTSTVKFVPDNINAQFELFYNEKSATISDSCIINNINDNDTEMKRTTFLTLLLLTLQSASFGQSPWSIHAGGSAMLLPHNIKTIDNPLWKGFNFGFERQWKLGESNFSFSTGLGLKYLLPPKEYSLVQVDYSSRSDYERSYSNLYTFLIYQELNSGTFVRPCLQFYVPLYFNYHAGPLEPFIGVVYSLSNHFDIEDYSSSDRMANLNNLELAIGSKYWFTKKWAVSGTVSKSTIGIRNLFNEGSFTSLGVDEYYFKPVSFDLNISYSF